MQKVLLLLVFIISLFSGPLFGADDLAPDDKSANHSSSDYAFPLEEVLPPPPKDNNRFYNEFLDMLASLGLIIALIVLMAWFLKRIMHSRLKQINVTSPIKILERRLLSQKTTIYLVEIHGKGIAIAETQGGVALLAQFDTLPKEEEEPDPKSFEKILEQKSKSEYDFKENSDDKPQE